MEKPHYKVRIRREYKVQYPNPIRVAAGELNGGLALMEGKIKLKGDLDVAARLGEMFGDQPRY